MYAYKQITCQDCLRAKRKTCISRFGFKLLCWNTYSIIYIIPVFTTKMFTLHSRITVYAVRGAVLQVSIKRIYAESLGLCRLFGFVHSWSQKLSFTMVEPAKSVELSQRASWQAGRSWRFSWSVLVCRRLAVFVRISRPTHEKLL